MRSFSFKTADTIQDALKMAASGPVGPSHVGAPSQYLAGGTTLVDLMALDVMRPTEVVDINPLARDANAGRIQVTDKGIRFGALVRMEDAANDPHVQTVYPVISETLSLAASTGLRNMASLAGNTLQRTRCSYFRDVGNASCNKRTPGSGCAAIGGVNRNLAVLGVSDHCIANYPGDFAQALIALDAVLEIQGLNGGRTLRFADLHRKPGDTPNVETTLMPGELITAINVPAVPGTKRSVYVKVRDRTSYAFALASAAVILDMEGETAKSVRIALGGVASVPWRAVEAETELTGKPITEDTVKGAADAAFADAKTHGGNAYKVALGKATLTRAVFQAAAMNV